MGCFNSKQLPQTKSVIELINTRPSTPEQLNIHELILLQKINNYNNMNPFFNYDNDNNKTDLNLYKAHMHILGL